MCVITPSFNWCWRLNSGLFAHQGLGGARPYSSRVRGEMDFQEQGNQISKVRSPRRSGNKSSQSARTNLVVETKKLCDVNSNCAKSHHVDPKVKTPLENCAPRSHTSGTSCSAETFSDLPTHPNEHLSSGTRLVQSPKDSSQPSMYLTILNEFFKPERLTKLENKVKRRTVEALEKLSKNIEEARLQQEQLLQDSRLLQQEAVNLETENNYFLKFLRKQNDQCKKKHEDLWNQYFRECGELKRRKLELASRFARQNADLQAQLLHGKNTQTQLRQQAQSLMHINEVKKSQDMKMQALQKELANMKVETVIKDHQAHLQFLQRKTLLDRQLQELKWLQMGKEGTKEVKDRAQALESTVKKVNSEFCFSFQRAYQKLQEKLVKQVQEYRKLESIKRQLEVWKEQLKEEQWVQEASVRGRQQLKAEREKSEL
ncbi:coiled-coil domain-containing protein 121 [Arvicola amphibius]|uniref:coiled-coil domain-containing protein 121 n=1 Tax=Arvicola amphibius TaxID=1047088 RepID=UPI001C09BF4C|nr:coiled-coil domain-containing protein 121 [Arvicola amphibius]